jgi:hypothetical protein
MNGLTSRGRDAATPEERGHDGRADPPGDRETAAHATRSSRPRGHDPVAEEIDVDGASVPVDRCRFCGTVIVNPQRPGGPCPGPNHTLDAFGIAPSARGKGAEPPTGTLRSGSPTPADSWEDEKEQRPLLAAR